MLDRISPSLCITLKSTLTVTQIPQAARLLQVHPIITSAVHHPCPKSSQSERHLPNSTSGTASRALPTSTSGQSCSSATPPSRRAVHKSPLLYPVHHPHCTLHNFQHPQIYTASLSDTASCAPPTSTSALSCSATPPLEQQNRAPLLYTVQHSIHPSFCSSGTASRAPPTSTFGQSCSSAASPS